MRVKKCAPAPVLASRPGPYRRRHRQDFSRKSLAMKTHDTRKPALHLGAARPACETFLRWIAMSEILACDVIKSVAVVVPDFTTSHLFFHVPYPTPLINTIPPGLY